MGAFSGMKDAKRGFMSNRLTEGDYLARVDRCDHFESQQNGEMFKVTLTILTVQSGPHKEGEVVTTIFARKHGTPQWLSNIKSFIAGVMGVDDAVVDEAATIRCLDPEQVLSGTVARVKAVLRASKKSRDEKGNPRDYSVYSWGQALTPDEIATALGPERLARFFPNGL